MALVIQGREVAVTTCKIDPENISNAKEKLRRTYFHIPLLPSRPKPNRKRQKQKRTRRRSK